jgi:hypothetical protein
VLTGDLTQHQISQIMGLHVPGNYALAIPAQGINKSFLLLIPYTSAKPDASSMSKMAKPHQVANHLPRCP